MKASKTHLHERPTLPLMTDDIVAVDIEPRIITSIDLIHPKNQNLSSSAKRFVGMVNARVIG